jgi:flagellar hook protein FlgE
MGLTSALNVSLNGLSLNETAIDVIGNNVANAGTTGFKASKVLFSTQLANTLSAGSAPRKESTAANARTLNGGTNPRQIGLGAAVTSIQADFSQGGVTATTSPSDLAIQGDGFFVVDETGNGNSLLYTRNGNFRLDSENFLVNAQGMRVMGYAADEDFNLVTTTLSNLQVDLGAAPDTRATTAIKMAGALSPSGEVATRGTLLTSSAILDSSTGVAATNATLLTNVRLNGDLVTPVFAGTDVIEFSPSKGGRTMETKTFKVTSGATPAVRTLGEYMAFMDQSMGIDNITYTGANVEPDGVNPGITLNASGQMLIKGNRGVNNDIEIPVGAIKKQGGGTVSLAYTKSTVANGESTTTSFTIYDSKGTPLTVRMTAWRDGQTSAESSYRFTLESAHQRPDEALGIQQNKDIFVGSGTLRFDTSGKLINTDAQTFTMLRYGVAANEALVFAADFTGIAGITSSGSNLNLQSQNGTPPGVLTSFVIDDQGRVNGAYDNGIIRVLGQLVLSRFSNPNGLLAVGGDNFRKGLSSGEPQNKTPGAEGAGTLRAGALELSNTDIGKNLVDLIVASTNYRGNARVISSVNDLVNELLALGR